MVKKLTCNETGIIRYIPEKRYIRMLARYHGDAKSLEDDYVSTVGMKLREGKITEMPPLKNLIKCSVSGEYCYITNERLKAGISKYGSEEELRNNYISREAKRKIKNKKCE